MVYHEFHCKDGAKREFTLLFYNVCHSGLPYFGFDRLDFVS